MKVDIVYPVLFCSLLFASSVLFAQQMPLVYDVENTGADYPEPPLLSFSSLPVITKLPDPFEWADGRARIASFSDWRCRRAEIAAQLQHYELGSKPAPPDSENLEASYSEGILTVVVREGANSLTLTANISLPGTGTGPFPAVIGVGSPTGSLPSDIFTGRGVATIQFNYWEVAPWTQSGRGQGGFYTLYPDTKVGYFTAWVWGISRIIDGLERLPEINIDTKHLAVTGCSFAGKIALFAGALDERIALTIPQESGGGGDAAWRVTETLSGSRETLRNAQSYGWYSSDVTQFNSTVTKLPYDHHEVMALIAPRALFVLGNPSQTWLAEESGYVSCIAASEVWKALGVSERFGFSAVGDHDHCALPNSQKPEIGAFVDKFLLGKTDVNTSITTNPGFSIDPASWITWSTPSLVEGDSYFNQAVLHSPEDQSKDLQQNIAFSWNKAAGAEKYVIELALDAAFTSVVLSDSTTDTLLNINSLSQGKNYYWHVSAKNSAGIAGPWSKIWSFSTYIALPSTPVIYAADAVPNRSGYMKFSWGRVQDADKYILQLSKDETFADFFKSDSTTSDTVKTISGLLDEHRYFWRMQTKNLAGASAWTKAEAFAILTAPTELALQINASNQAALSWKDNASVEDGYIIERKENSDTSFNVIDTVQADISEYTDISVEKLLTYTYRVKAYTGVASSLYSNEASLTLVGVNDNTALPKEYSISQNYPNPFNPVTRISFALPKSALTKITIYNILGKEVKVLVNKELDAGRHEINIDASDLSSGVYFYKIQSGSFVQTKKMTLLK